MTSGYINLDCGTSWQSSTPEPPKLLYHSCCGSELFLEIECEGTTVGDCFGMISGDVFLSNSLSWDSQCSDSNVLPAKKAGKIRWMTGAVI